MNKNYTKNIDFYYIFKNLILQNFILQSKKIDNFIIYSYKFNNYCLLNLAYLIIYINLFVLIVYFL